MSNKLYYKVSAAIFLAIAFLHLLRIANGWESSLGNIQIPMWVSVAALLIAGYLSYRGFTTARAK